MADRADGARRFGAVVVGGLAAGTAAAVVGNQPWVSVEASQPGSGDAAFAAALSGVADASAPPVTATALVLLASWGVVLVTRGGFRRAVAWLGLVAALGVLGFAVAAWIVAPDTVVEQLPSLEIETTHTAWSYVGILAGVAAVLTSLLAVRGVAGWPEMGRRYDAPADGASAAPSTPVEEQSSLDVWKALDEGRDPTDATDPTDASERDDH